MENSRYDYSPIIQRKRLKWPAGARLAFWVCSNIEYFHIDKPIPAASSSYLPDIQGYSLLDYRSRIGALRMTPLLHKYRIRPTVLPNAAVCDLHPAIIEEGKKRTWEWLGHGMP